MAESLLNQSISPSSPVSVSVCDKYDAETIKNILKNQFSALGISENYFKNKKVVIKPNLVMKKSAEAAATTHPAMIEALSSLLCELGGHEIIIAESPGGIYSESNLKSIYKVCGIEEAAFKSGISLNFDTGFKEIKYPDGIVSKSYNIINPIADADIIINLCKLKSHSLTKMSCAVKNLFGVIPGVQKFEMHARFPNLPDFSAMLVDLCKCVCQMHEVIHIADAIVGMEGNGPTGGNPRFIGAIISSRNPYNLDLSAADLLGFDDAPLIKCAYERGFCPKSNAELAFTENSVFPQKINDFVMPDSVHHKNFFTIFPDIMGGNLVKILEPHPKINYKTCVGCGDCVRSCPVHTIDFVTIKNKRKAKIKRDKCIKCFCCQELCPHKAVYIVKNPILSILK